MDGKYRVERLLGEGGMAAVWAGTNERTGKRVALKVILRSLATTKEAQGLFHGEALAASRVNHPNVVTVFDVIEHEGMPCIVMELLDGEPLGSYIAFRGFLTVSEATTVLLPAMRGVAAAHAQGVIHRDLKPQNIFICIGPDGRVVTTKVLDFGISVMMERVMDRSAGPAPALAMGTPAYMSPEHLMGSDRIDERSDVYGFGVLLYEALTGQTPFTGQPGPELFHRILNDPPPPLAQLRPDLPPGLIRIIEIALAKQPSSRYANLNLLLASIEDELAPATPAPRPLTPSVGVPEYVLRERTARNSSSAVQAVAQQEPSGQFPETQLFVAPPAENSDLVAGAPEYAPRDTLPGDTTSPVQGVVQPEQSGQFPETQLFIAPPAEDGKPVQHEEPSGQFSETQLFIERPTEKEIPVVDGSNDGQADDVDDGLPAAALPLPMEAKTSPSPAAKSPITIPLSGLRSLAVFQDRRWLVGAGCAIALVFAVWMAVRSTSGNRRVAPPGITRTAPTAAKPPVPPVIPAAVPAATSPAAAAAAVAPTPTPPAVAVPTVEATPAQPAVAVPTAEATPAQPAAAVPAPAAVSPSSAPAATARSESTRSLRDVPARASHRRSAAKNTALPTRNVGRVALDRHASAALNAASAPTADSSTKTTTTTPAPAARPSTKSATPRAGSLSADDF